MDDVDQPYGSAEELAEELIDEYAWKKSYVEERKPYWLSLRHPRDGEMHWELYSYFPAGHYEMAIDAAIRLAAIEEFDLEGDLQPDGGRPVPDGGRYTDTLYAWHDSDTGTYLTHVEAGDEFATPFFEAEDDARRYLDHRAHEVADTARFEGLSLHKFRAKKVGEAVEVLTDQTDIDEFMPDGGHQIANPRHDRIWFWYNPAADMIIQEEVEPYEVVGLFESEDDADRFIRQYVRQYGLDDASHLEKYSAKLTYEGQGPVYENIEDRETEDEETKQAGFSDFLRKE